MSNPTFGFKYLEIDGFFDLGFLRIAYSLMDRILRVFSAIILFRTERETPLTLGVLGLYRKENGDNKRERGYPPKSAKNGF